MRIQFVVHLFPPKHNCGGESYIFHTAKYLQSRGHDVRVLLLDADWYKIKTPYIHEGIMVLGDPKSNLDAYRWADVNCTHLDKTSFVINICRMIKRPVVCFLHSHHTYEPNPILRAPTHAVSVVYNSHWIREILNYPHPGIVMYPPVDYNYYNVNENPEDNPYVSMISVNENKGGYLLYRIAQRMPDIRFLAVVGSYDDGYIQPEIIKLLEKCPNVKIVPNDPDIRKYYRQTRVLLVLSRYESWGMVATEGMCNGIPVIACPTPGLQENCQDAAIYAPKRGEYDVDKQTGKVIQHDGESYDIEPVVDEIRKLEDKEYYQAYSAAGRKRAMELKPDTNFLELENHIINAQRVFGY